MFGRALLVLAGLAGLGLASTDPPVAPEFAAGAGEGRRDLDRLLEGELQGDLDALWSADRDLALQVAVLRAGRDVPATVSAARRAEREETRAETLDWLRARRAQDAGFASAWSNLCEGLLAAPEQEVLWCATARSLGRLRDASQARELGRGLGSRRPEVVQASRDALFDLYLRWFAGPVDFEGFWQEHDGACEESLSREVALRYERKARELEVQLLEHEPQRAGVLMDSPDPRLRAAAARVLARTEWEEGPSGPERLLERLASERDGAAYHAGLEALLDVLGAALPDDPQLVALRAQLVRVVSEGHDELQAPAAHALSRLAWSHEPEGEASILRGFEVLADQSRQLSVPGSLADRDTLVASMQALWTLGEAARDAGLDLGAAARPVREVVLRSVREEREYEGVRVAAARLLSTVGRPRDIALAVEVMDAPRTSAELGYTLLGEVGEMARGMAPDDPSADRLLETLLSRLEKADPDLRRRALAHLSDPELAEFTRRADAAHFVRSLGSESLPDLQAQLLALVAEFGAAEHVAALLELPTFDDIANSGPAGIAQLVQTLRHLTGSDAELRLASARRLIHVENDDNRVSRLAEALGLVAELDPEAAADLSLDSHQAVVAWSRELRRSGGAMPGGTDFLRRLVDLHLPACAAADDLEAPNLAHLQALFLTDLLAAAPEAEEDARVLAHFEEALTSAEERERETERALVLRDRARFHLLRGQDARALADYRAVFSGGPPEAVEAEQLAPSSSVLDLADLRRGGELIVASAPATESPSAARVAAQREAAREALAVSLALVRREAWANEPAGVRARDLGDLARRALAARSLAALELARTHFRSLPPLPEAATEENGATASDEPVGVTWRGLLAEPETHAALLEHAAALTSLRTELEAEAAAAAVEGQEGDSESEVIPEEGEAQEAVGEGVVPEEERDAVAEEAEAEGETAPSISTPSIGASSGKVRGLPGTFQLDP